MQRPPHRSQTSQTSGTRHTLQVEDEGGAASYNMLAVQGEGRTSEPIKVTMLVSGASLEMGVDTGASSSIISESTYHKVWPKNQAPPLQPTQRHLCTYTKESLDVKGAFTANVQYQDQVAELELVVISRAKPSLPGRDWLQEIKLDWQGLNQIQPT